MAYLSVQGVSYTYRKGTPWETHALKDVNLEIARGERLGLVGPSGSGKSTLLQLLNGLILPETGKVEVDGRDLSLKENRRRARAEVGLVFQSPEQQLFAETVFKDVAFAPRQQGLHASEIKKRVVWALEAVGLVPAEVSGLIPFKMSGGQKRRVAIAGVLAMAPSVLVLDEPTSGLDATGKNKLLETLLRLNRENGVTLVVVSHCMDDIAYLATRVVALEGGRVVGYGKPRDFFSQEENLSKIRLEPPETNRLLHELKRRGAKVATNCLGIEEISRELLRWLQEKGRA